MPTIRVYSTPADNGEAALKSSSCGDSRRNTARNRPDALGGHTLQHRRPSNCHALSESSDNPTCTPALLIAGAVAAGLVVASERHGSIPIQRQQMASVLSTGELTAMARTEAAGAPTPWVSPKPMVMVVSVATTTVAHAPRWVPLPPRRAEGL